MKRPSFLHSLFWVVSQLFAALLLVASVLPYISLEKFPAISLLSLMVPLLMLVNLFFLIFWMLMKKRKWLLPFLALGVSYLVLGSFYKLGNQDDRVVSEDLALMSFNTRAFNKYEWADNPGLGDEIIDFIGEQDPDVVCFQEFEIIRASQLAQFPYKYVNTFFPKDLKVVQAIFSKYPIIATGSLDFPHSHNNAIFADIIYGEDTLRLYNVHLESLRINPTASTITGEPSVKLYKRLGKAFSKQEAQAKLLEAHSAKTQYKKLICGDFNNTQFSNVYHIVKGGLTDTFDEKGTGYGSTYNIQYFPARIDFILADPAFEVKTHQVFNVELSDHFPIMASLSLEKQ